MKDNFKSATSYDRIIQDPQLCVCANLRKAARAVTQVYDEALKPCGIRSTQSNILTVLSLAGPLSISELAHELVMDRTTLARNLKPLEAQGLLTVMPGQDQRVRLVQLTPAGHEVLNTTLPLREQAQTHMVEKLGRKKVDDLLGYLSDAVTISRDI